MAAPTPPTKPSPGSTRPPSAALRIQPSPRHGFSRAPRFIIGPSPTPFVQSPDSPPAPPETQTQATVSALPLWRRHSRRISAAVGVAAAVIIAAAIVIPFSTGGGAPARTSVAIPLHVTDAGKAIGYTAATGRATARQTTSGSWNITLTVAHLKHFDPAPWYGCWYVSRDGQQVTSAGTFLVPKNGSATLPMTSAVDPHDFPTMEITIQPPNKSGARAGTVILSGRTL